MRKSHILKGILALFAFSDVFALNVDSLPVWNPSSDSFFRGGLVEPVDTTSGKSNLETHGYKTMQVTVGDGGTQVDQELRLSIQGTVGDSVNIDALLSDVDRKAGDQTTATLQEVDQIYFRAESKHWMIHLGDFTWKEDCLGLYSFERSSLGAMFGLKSERAEVRGAVGTDEVNRLSRVMSGVSGQREGYSVSENGDYLVIVPQSESVWLNGVKLIRGVDYEMNYAGGLLDFKGMRAPNSDDEIRVEYDAYEDENIFNLYAAGGKYRHPNLYLDISGFRLENDKDRLKRSAWTDDDYALLKKDRGEDFERADTLGTLNRPMRTDRAGARLRWQGKNRYYADLEIAMNRMDSNIVSDKVGGPRGHAYRWHLTSDSSSQMKKFPVAFSVYGNFIEEGFNANEFQGQEHDWNSYILKDEWDLDSSVLVPGNLRHDEFGMRIRLGESWFSSVTWGYRQGENEEWNSSRAKWSLLHRLNSVESNVSVVRVVSMQNDEKERYQAIGSTEFLQGRWRPFGNFDLRYTEINELDSDRTSDVVSHKTGAGIRVVDALWNIGEGIEVRQARLNEENEGWGDSLRSVAWTQNMEWRTRYVEFNHFLQYENREEKQSGNDQSWVGDLNALLNADEKGVVANVSYKLGLTEEQTYTAVYKAVAPGTGDVRYDSLTGTFIEGVDNGNFVYEGMGRNDSVGAVLSSNATFGMDFDWNPGKSLQVNEGFLRDVSFGGTFNATSEDTSGKKIYFPMVTPSKLRTVTSGNVSWEGRVNWSHSSGFSLAYKPGAEYDKKYSSISYFETIVRHEVDASDDVNESHFISAILLFEKNELNAAQNLKWNTRDYSGRYRFSFLDGFRVEPGGRYRVGDGVDDEDCSFDAHMVEGSFLFGYDRTNILNAFLQFSAIEMKSGGDAIPYRMMAGYGEGRTYRMEANVSLDINDFISLGVHYVLRFGNAEENVFQKLTSEARAYF